MSGNVLKVIVISIMLVAGKFSFGQITVSSALTPQQLVQDVLLGSGISVSNVTFTGSGSMRGTFTGTSNLGIDEGIILATGDISVAIGPNDEMSASAGGGVAGDAMLTTLGGNTTYDAAVLEFDFIPSSDTVRFFYVFGSEEYPEYVCSDFNDVFAFFLSGPNPAGGNYVNKNIAQIPGTTIPVAINSINPGVVGSMGTSGGCISLSYSSLYNNNASGTTIQYDGFTDVLEASANVIACETYHIKIAIADVMDGAFDSGVFLKAKSFSSPAIGISAVGSSFDSTMVEGCGYATYIFTRGGSLVDDFTIDYIIGGTAINGTDYQDLSGQPITSSITFLAGEDTAYLYINPVNDALPEYTETISIAIPQVISCIEDTLKALIYITNVDPIHLTVEGDPLICAQNGESSELHVTFTGGYGPFTYQWDQGLGNDSIVSVNPSVPTVYTVSILDTCGNESAVAIYTVVNECPVDVSNVITPNGDGINDFLVFKNIDMYPGSKLVVYNRWGGIVYESSSYSNNWDGAGCAEGTYFYILEQAEGIQQQAQSFHGTVTIFLK